MKLMCAPMQGFTEAPFRHFHAGVYGAADCYFSPFLRVDHGAVRGRDLRDVTSPLNANHRLVAQVIFRDADEFSMLVRGHGAVDMNLGCPFPLQTRRGRGAAMVARRDVLEEVADLMAGMPDVTFSVKMRLGMTDPTEWRETVDVLNRMALTHVTVHPRVASQQYSGGLHLDAFESLAGELRHPVVFNGDLDSVVAIGEIAARYPWLHGVMAGRGLLARPSLFAEWRSGREWSRDERLQGICRLHEGVYGHYRSCLCGDSQILSKIKPFWDYLGGEIDRKVMKSIRKAGSVAGYETAVAALQWG